jgi:BMFP domain-containing protein YqiC
MSSRVTRIARQVKHVWDELDYAQRRMFEVRTGIPVTPEGERALARAEITKLEAVLATEDSENRSVPERSLQHAA